jgi:hypothetical protein
MITPPLELVEVGGWLYSKSKPVIGQWPLSYHPLKLKGGFKAERPPASPDAGGLSIDAVHDDCYGLFGVDSCRMQCQTAA